MDGQTVQNLWAHSPDTTHRGWPEIWLRREILAMKNLSKLSDLLKKLPMFNPRVALDVSIFIAKEFTNVYFAILVDDFAKVYPPSPPKKMLFLYTA